MYEYLLNATESFIRYGMSPTALVVALIALFKTKRFKRFVGRRAPWLFRDDADVINYQARQIRIEQDVRAIKEHLGVKEWGVDYLTGRNAHNETSGAPKKSLSRLVAYAHAVIAKFFTLLKGTYHFQQRRMKMKSKLLSRKFILALATGILVILNDGLDMGLQTETIMYVVGIVAVWITGEAAVDVSSRKTEVSQYDSKALDSVRKDSEDTGYTASN